MESALLARLQFGFTVSFHIIFPTLTIGLSGFIAALALMGLVTGEGRYQRLARYWTKIFAVSFAMGVVSGVVLSYELGTNWSRFSLAAGNIIGPLAGYEVMAAFFLETTFLSIMLFGTNRVPRWLQSVSAVIVAFGTAISAFWILSANSWMNTPAGHALDEGVAYPIDWYAIVFNPSFVYRLWHMLNASYLTAGFVVLAVGARFLIARRHMGEARTMLRMGLGVLAVLAPLQLLLGDLHGLNTLAHQPIKIAAMEAHWDSTEPGDFHIFAWPDEAAELNRFAISIPRGASLILTHDPDGRFPGLKEVDAASRPPVKLVFFAFRVMLAIGLFMIAIVCIGALLWLRNRLFTSGWYLRTLGQSWWIGFVAVLAGWIVTESGRQPWIIYEIMRTDDATSPVPGGAVAVTLGLFIIVYGLVFSFGIYYINRLIANGLESPTGEPPEFGPPLAAVRSPDHHVLRR
jgi:cytochrome bd ubiquinol oxidase subunit I